MVNVELLLATLVTQLKYLVNAFAVSTIVTCAIIIIENAKQVTVKNLLLRVQAIIYPLTHYSEQRIEPLNITVYRIFV